jgi:hypothetical protein
MAAVVRKVSSPPGAQQPCGLRDPPARVGPETSSVLRDGEIEAGVGMGDCLRVAVNEGKRDAKFRLEATGAGQLGGGVVDPDRSGSSAGEPGRHIGGPATELDRIESVHVVDQVKVGLGDVPDAPRWLGASPRAMARRLDREAHMSQAARFRAMCSGG